jgi:3-oxoacyl-[acyl-carrier protein] reductase
LITGASRGLGLAIAKRLIKDKYKIICISRQISAELKDLVNSNPDMVVFRPYDLSNLEGIPSLVNNITKKYGSLYGLINNAGVGLDGLLATQHASEISKVLKVNLEAPILMTKYVCRHMLIQMTGRIINVSSIIASTGFSGLSVYAASKAGLEGFTRSLSRELGRVNVTANCIAPGYMKTEMTKGLKGKKLESIERRAPLGLPVPEDVVGAVALLLSKEGAKITGSVITIDGGTST